jgi:hypothetical protein
VTTENTTAATSSVDLSTLTSLTPLRGKLSVIHADNFFHLFDEKHQRELAHNLGSLLSPEPGSFLFGQHVANATTSGVVEWEAVGENAQRLYIFGHSPQSWQALWEEVFGAGKAEVKVQMKVMERKDLKQGLGNAANVMIWSVKRL